LPPPPTDEELASISSSNLLDEKLLPKEIEQKSDWRSHVDGSGKTYYFNVKTQISQWKKPDELVSYHFKLPFLMIFSPPLYCRRQKDQWG
jgi:hypothetical protein